MSVAEVAPPAAAAPLRYDPLQPEHWRDPYPTYRRLRDEAPVHHAPGSGTWTVSRYEDVVQVLRQPELFSSESAFDVLFAMMTQGIGWRDVLPFLRFMVRARVSPTMLRQGPTESMITLDPPRHDALRGIVNRGFTPRRIGAWQERVGEIVAGCMQKLEGVPDFDVIQDLAIPVPVEMIAEILGVEPERRAAFKGWSDRVVAGISSADRKRARPALIDALVDLSRYVESVVRERRSHPRDDLISLLVDPAQGETLDDPTIMQFILLLLIAGNETTTNAIGNAVVALLRHPEQLERVAADPDLVPALIEETIRWDGPVQFIFRRATRDVELAGRVVPKDARVAVLIGSANRDERRFPEPDRFDIDRETRGHVGFGLGVHFCLGASLARLEADAALRAIVPELPRLRAVGDLDDMVDSVLVRGRRHIRLQRSAPIPPGTSA